MDKLNETRSFPLVDDMRGDTIIVAAPERIRRRRYFKREARYIIFSGGNWYKLVFASIFMMMTMVSVKYICGSFFSVFNGGQNAESYFTDILYLAVIVPLLYGFYAYNITLTDNETPRFGVMFDVFGSLVLLVRAYKVFFTYLWRYFIWLAVIYGALKAIDIYAGTVLISTLSLAAAAVFIIIGLVFLQRYYLTLYVAIYNNNMTVHEAVKHSVSLMKGYKFDTLMFQFEFALWFIISYLTLGIAAVVYVIPYYVLANLQFSKFIFNTNSKENLTNE